MRVICWRADRPGCMRESLAERWFSSPPEEGRGSSGANPKAEGRRPKEGRNPKAEARTALGLGFRPSDFGLRPSFGLRVSAFGFQIREGAIPLLDGHWMHSKRFAPFGCGSAARHCHSPAFRLRHDARKGIPATSATDCFDAGPGVGFENLRQGGVGHRLVSVHGASNHSRNVREADLPVYEGVNGDFIGRV